jgi:hypothetical protein
LRDARDGIQPPGGSYYNFKVYILNAYDSSEYTLLYVSEFWYSVHAVRLIKTAIEDIFIDPKLVLFFFNIHGIDIIMIYRAFHYAQISKITEERLYFVFD